MLTKLQKQIIRLMQEGAQLIQYSRPLKVWLTSKGGVTSSVRMSTVRKMVDQGVIDADDKNSSHLQGGAMDTVYKLTKSYRNLTSDEVEDLMRPCPEGTDDMFWRQDEEARIHREHEETRIKI